MPYITPRRFRTMGLGVDIGERSDAELGALLEISTDKVDTYCNVPPQHSFLGGTITDEQRVWHTGNTHNPGQRRIWPEHRPIKSLGSVAIDVTNGQFIEFDPGNVYIDHRIDSIEITSLQLTPASVFVSGLAPYIALQRPRSRVSYTYGWDLVTHERITTPETTMPGQEFDLANQFVTASGVSVTRNGTVLTPGADYELDAYEGVLTLIAPIKRTDAVYIDYHYPLPGKIARATALIGADVVSWSNQMSAGLGGLSGIKVNEVELRASKSAGFATVPVNPAAQEILSGFMYRNFGMA